MTVQALPWAIQGQSHSAEIGRNQTAALLCAPVSAFTNSVSATTAGGAHGVMSPNDLNVVQNGTPNMSVNVAAGRAFIRSGNASSIAAGVYAVMNDATVNVAISASDPTNPRIDLVVIQVRDTNYGEAASDARITVVTGTPAASPAVPSLASFPNALVLVQVAVAAATTTIVNANITDRRTYASAVGGIRTVTSSTNPTGVSLYAGLTIFELDTLRMKQYDGTGWVIMSEPAQTSTPTVATTVGSITTLGTVDFKYTRSDGWLNWQVQINITTNGTGAGVLTCTVPVNADNATTYFSVGSGRENGVSGKMLMVWQTAGNQLRIVNYDNTYPGANGAVIVCHGRYRMTTRYS